MNKLNSLTIFFPFFNDEKTVASTIDKAYLIGHQVAKNLEVIAIHGGPSKDKTWVMIQKQKKKYPDLIIIDKTNNKKGYAVIKYGLQAASQEWVFYTDGDGQYDIAEISKLIREQQKNQADVVNGYKIKRCDNLARKLTGEFYRRFSTRLFRLPIRDTDCDFRLIKNSNLKKISLTCNNASILPEMIKKLEMTGARFAEVPVNHYPRRYGKSNYHTWNLLKEKILGDLQLYRQMKSDDPSLTSLPKLCHREDSNL